ncbi:Gonadal protein gdl [Eumeta japonica]|uniref:Gonadal protein gdl n=1 Tax=Eumeta variegata TaxID=151549 RepID=A0A4C1XJL2_EUMVA|nr:Gonadal protein gdl [Eumeta japonica]
MDADSSESEVQSSRLGTPPRKARKRHYEQKYSKLWEKDKEFASWLQESDLKKLIVNVCSDREIAKEITFEKTKAQAIVTNVTGKLSHTELVKTLHTEKFSLIVDESTDKSTTKHLALIARTAVDFNVEDQFLCLIPIVDGLCPENITELDREWRLLRNMPFNFTEKNVDPTPEEFWKHVSSIKKGDQSPMFPLLCEFIRKLLALPHSSANVERLFSAINNMKTCQRKRICTETLEGLLLEIHEMIKNTPNPEEQEVQKSILLTKHKEEMQQTDMKLVIQLDQKVSDQQMTLAKAGVPGFFVTNKPIEIKVQMYLLDFILRLSKMDIP